MTAGYSLAAPAANAGAAANVILFVLPHILVAEDYDAAAAEGGGAAAKRQRLEALAGSDVASAYPDTSVQFDAAPALDHSSAVAAIAEAYAPVSRVTKLPPTRKNERRLRRLPKPPKQQQQPSGREKPPSTRCPTRRLFSPPALLRCHCAALSPPRAMLTRGQAQSKLEGVLSGIGGGDGGEALEWELPSDHEEEEAVQSSALRLTEEWKQYEATYGQSYTERYFASYYHSQVCCCCCCCCCLRSCVQQLLALL